MEWLAQILLLLTIKPKIWLPLCSYRAENSWPISMFRCFWSSDNIFGTHRTPNLKWPILFKNKFWTILFDNLNHCSRSHTYILDLHEAMNLVLYLIWNRRSSISWFVIIFIQSFKNSLRHPFAFFLNNSLCMQETNKNMEFVLCIHEKMANIVASILKS